MISALSFGQPPPPPREPTRLSVSSSPQPSMSSSSDSPMQTPTFDSISSTVEDARISEEIVPKTEELEVSLSDVKPEPTGESPVSPTRPQMKRPRGRPRKNPIIPPSAHSKAMKGGRSKTGCLTCRRRKKKCDETKPTCLSCQKNNVVCEGYRQKEFWRSGRERAEEERRNSVVNVQWELPTLMEGVENDLDRELLQHFISKASRVLSLKAEQNNPFTRTLLPMAMTHKGLMHSILCLSASHLSSTNPTQEVAERQWYHQDRAITLLNEAITQHNSGNGSAELEDPIVAQTLVHLLRAICDGDVSGEYRLHMEGAKQLLMSQKIKNPEFESLFQEFFYFHWVLSRITSLNSQDITMMEDFKLPFRINPESATLIGVADGLFGYISKISNLRRRIRARIDNHEEPLIDYEGFAAIHAIDSGLREWVCPRTPGTPQYTASMLYKQAAWVYLYRTTKPSKPDPFIKRAVDDGIGYIHDLPPDGPEQSCLLTPLFLMGCAAFEKEQQSEIAKAFESLVASTGLKNIEFAWEVVKDVWVLMEQDDNESWDWEKLINQRGWDFLVT